MDFKRRPELNPRRLIGYGFVFAMVAAPFLALLYGLTWGLTVMACALAATSLLAIDAARGIGDPALRKRLRLLAFVNGLFTLAVVAALLARL